MIQVALTERLLDDLARMVDFLQAEFPATAKTLRRRTFEALAILAHHPGFGRPVSEESLVAIPAYHEELSDELRSAGKFRELMISQGRSGYLALYHYMPSRQLIRVLALRHQREAGYH